jgi:hypothetical protein
MKFFAITFVSILLLVFAVATPSHSQDQPKLDQFTGMMDKLINDVTSIESAYGPRIGGAIAEAARTDAYNHVMPELEVQAMTVSGVAGDMATRYTSLMETARSSSPTDSILRPVLNELRVRSTVLDCDAKGIGPDVVKDYIARSTASFVADRGNFFYPGFDESKLAAEDFVKIYFAGFGLVVLLQMNGGPDQAIALYQGSTELRPYFAQQLVFRGADLDMAGIPLLKAVLFDESIMPSAREVFYGVLAGKMIGPAGQFGGVLTFSDQWRSTVAGWAFDHISTPERLASRAQAPMHGVSFGQEELGPESLIGLAGSPAETQVLSLLGSPDLMMQTFGLEAVGWIDTVAYPDYAARMFAVAEPFMNNDDFVVAVLAMRAFETDAAYTGKPYDDARRARLDANIPALCTLMDNVIKSQSIDYLSTSAWLDIASEGSLVDRLDCVMPMVAKVIAADWARKQAGNDVPLPEGEIDLISHFIPSNTQLFISTSDVVLGFLKAELDKGEVNPFRVWSYVHYLQAAKQVGVTLSQDWVNSIVQLRAWADTAPALIKGDELKSALDGLLK